MVLIDSCVWLSTALLRNPRAIALLHFMRDTGTRLALPEVVEEELRLRVLEECSGLTQAISRDVGRLEAFMGRHVAPPLRVDAEVSAVFDERLVDLRTLLVRIPFTAAHARGALGRVLRKEPPADKAQEFKDAAIWEAALSIARTAPVTIVSTDKAFFDGRVYERGLASNLVADAKARGVCIELTHDVSLLLAANEPHVLSEPPRHRVIEFLSQLVAQYLMYNAARDDPVQVTGPASSGEVTPFATDNPHQYSYDFRLRVNVAHAVESNDERVARFMDVEGSALVQVPELELVSFDIDQHALVDEHDNVITVVPWSFGDGAIIGERARRIVRTPLSSPSE